ncbi:hypothetical protein F4806DRAFT_181483 [Annulohypoxylon nitens]|nr:hypothetical protein F4806DRAFT_181483 [Annulohypoxylon nitens]
MAGSTRDAMTSYALSMSQSARPLGYGQRYSTLWDNYSTTAQASSDEDDEEIPGFEDDEGQASDSADSAHDERIIITPGCPPRGQGLNQQDRPVTRLSGIDRPELFFENLCLGAIEQGQISAVKSADFVTDIDSLWGLLAAVHAKVSGVKYGRTGKKARGLMIIVQVIHGIIFMKILNLHDCDRTNIQVAEAHLKKDGVDWCYAQEAAEGKREESQTSKAFKRVISYTFGKIRMVIQDDKQALSTRHSCPALGRGIVKGPDGLD